MKNTEQANSDLRTLVINNLETRCKAIFGKELPAVLNSREVIGLGIRPKEALNSDATDGIGLKPLPGSRGKGRPRQYLLSTCVDALIEGLSHQGGTAA